jgi:hypothetical protein
VTSGSDQRGHKVHEGKKASNPELSLALTWGLLRCSQDPAGAAALLAALEANASLAAPSAAEARYLHGVVRLDGADACGGRFRAIISGVDRPVRIPGGHIQ